MSPLYDGADLDGSSLPGVVITTLVRNFLFAPGRWAFLWKILNQFVQLLAKVTAIIDRQHTTEAPKTSFPQVSRAGA